LASSGTLGPGAKMTPGWELMKAIYFSAIEMKPELREQYVREAAACDPKLIKKILSLLLYESDRTIPAAPVLPFDSTGFGPSERDLDILVQELAASSQPSQRAGVAPEAAK